MSDWFKLIIFSALLGIGKSHRFIQVVILAGLGLAGLWMAHTLAQDFNAIQTANSDRELFKRSISEKEFEIDWESVLSRDPVGCARSFLCQLSATREDVRSEDEKMMVDLVRYSSRRDNWAVVELKRAMKIGEKSQKPLHCMKVYKYCPYTSQVMMILVKLFGK